MDKAIFFIGGSVLQIPSINVATSLGLRTLLTDIRPNCEARGLADAFKHIGGDEIERLIEAAQLWSREFDICGVFCNNDFGLPAVAAINHALGLCKDQRSAVETCLDKARAKSIMRAEGLPTPEGVIVPSGVELEPAAINMPAIVKPLDGSGSRGVRYVEQRELLDDAVAAAREVSTDILIEHAIDGRHIDVSGFFANDTFYKAGQLDRFFSPLPYRYPVSGCQPPSIDEELQNKIYQLLEAAARAIGIDYGPIKADIIIDANGPQIIEVTPRFHGDVSTFFVCEACYGDNAGRAWFSFLKDAESWQPADFDRGDRSAAWVGIFAPRSGQISDIQIDKERLDKENVQFVQRKSIGDKIVSLTDNTAVVGFLIGGGSSDDDVIDKIEKLRTAVSVSILKNE